MRAIRRYGTLGITSCAAGLLLFHVACFAPPAEDSGPRTSYFVGIDVSGSFRASGRYADALEFMSRYIHAHLNGHGDLTVPRALFVGAIGGDSASQTQGFHPIHDFQGKDPAEIEADLRAWFPPNDRLTDFNAFFGRVATLAKRYNLVLGPIDIVVLSDGMPDVGASGPGPPPSPNELYAHIDFDPLEYLARNVTVRVLYPDPDVAANWEQRVERSRVRLWTVDRVVMQGWHEQLRTSPAEPAEAASGSDLAAADDTTGGADAASGGMAAAAPATGPLDQPDLWSWIEDNIDFRVRRGVL